MCVCLCACWCQPPLIANTQNFITNSYSWITSTSTHTQTHVYKTIYFCFLHLCCSIIFLQFRSELLQQTNSLLYSTLLYSTLSTLLFLPFSLVSTVLSLFFSFPSAVFSSFTVIVLWFYFFLLLSPNSPPPLFTSPLSRPAPVLCSTSTLLFLFYSQQ